MAYAYNSQAWLCCSNLDPSGSKTLSFANAAARDSWIAGMNPTVVTGCTFIRKDSTLVVGINADVLDAQGINYVCYTNPEVSGTKKFYAFVTKIEYKAMETSVLYLETDSFITYQFDIDLNNSECFIERQHVLANQDTIGANTLPEDVPIGELESYELQGFTAVFSGSNATVYEVTTWVQILTTKNITASPPKAFVTGSPVSYYIYFVNVGDFKTVVDKIIEDNGDCIIGIYPVAKNYYPESACYNFPYADTTIYTPHTSPDESTPIEFSVSPDFTRCGNGTLYHTVRNNKLNTYPFRYLELTDRNRQSMTLRYELFGGTVLHDPTDPYKFNTKYTIGIKPTFAVYPKGYNGDPVDLTHGLTLNSFQQIPYSVNKYAEYLALNENSLKFNLYTTAVNTVVGAVSSAGTGDVAGAISSVGQGIMARLATNAQMADKQKEPPVLKNMASDTMLAYTNNLTIDIIDKHLNYEYAGIVDRYFDMFGYNISRQGLPNWYQRPKYTYVKTLGCNMAGTIPSRDRSKINALFDAGITVWRYGTGTYGVYSNDNK